MPKEDFEVIIIDDMSTEDLSKAFAPFIGKLNIRHVRIDHTKHPIYSEMNPSGSNFLHSQWYHTPALALNIGMRKAVGDVLMFSQPEIIVNENSLNAGYMGAKKGNFVFGDVVLASIRFNTWLFDSQLGQKARQTSTKFILEEFESMHKNAFSDTGYKFNDTEMYWFVAFLDRSTALAVGGVDEEYLRGVYAEDDNFRVRIKYAGVPSVRDYEIQQRDGQFWQNGAAKNRDRYSEWLQRGPDVGVLANQGKDWGSDSCVVLEKNYALSI